MCANRFIELMDFVYDDAGMNGDNIADFTIIGFIKDMPVLKFLKGDKSIENLKKELNVDLDSQVLEKVMSFVVYVKRNDKIAIPHVHIRNEVFHTVISLVSPKYLIQINGKYFLYEEEQAAIFDEFMYKQIPNTNYDNLTNWNLALWAYTKIATESIFERPDYHELAKYDNSFDRIHVFDLDGDEINLDEDGELYTLPNN